jgi:transposase
VVNFEREQNIEVLRQAGKLLEQENRRLMAKVLELTQRLIVARGEDQTRLQLEIRSLNELLAQRNKALFGDSSERRPQQKTPNAGEPRKGHGPREQRQLRIVDQPHDLDAADKVCKACGGELEPMQDQAEESEEVTVIEREFVLVKHRRLKYRCACNGCIETALAPPRLVKGGRYSTDFAIEVAAQKYLDHLPLERQVRMMAREGLVIDSQTLWDQIEALARGAQPIYERLVEYMLSLPVLGADETRWRMMGAKGDEGESKRWQVWALAAPNAAVYRIEDSRSAAAARNILGGYRGVVMADGYGAYESLAKEPGSFTLANCWAHVRRKFIEIEEFFPEQAGAALKLIGELYEVERSCPAGPAGDELRASLRQDRSREIISRIHAWALAQRALPQSGLGKAIAYMGGLWKGLVRFLDDPRIPLDNNATERALRGVVVGRKNHYGSRSRRGTEVAAVLYSLMESAKLAGLEPKAYLRLAITAVLRGETPPLPHECAAP